MRGFFLNEKYSPSFKSRFAHIGVHNLHMLVGLPVLDVDDNERDSDDCHEDQRADEDDDRKGEQPPSTRITLVVLRGNHADDEREDTEDGDLSHLDGEDRAAEKGER